MDQKENGPEKEIKNLEWKIRSGKNLSIQYRLSNKYFRNQYKYCSCVIIIIIITLSSVVNYIYLFFLYLSLLVILMQNDTGHGLIHRVGFSFLARLKKIVFSSSSVSLSLQVKMCFFLNNNHHLIMMLLSAKYKLFFFSSLLFYFKSYFIKI